MNFMPFSGLAISPWRNGAGRKADIAAGPGWLIGFAFLDADAAFSDYAGHDRTITLVDGPGFSLTGPGRAALIVEAPYVAAPFDGGWPAQCHIHGAPCMVLNVMTARDRWRHSVSVLTPGGVTFDPDGAAGDVLVVLRGNVSMDGAEAGRHDALRLDAPIALHASADALVCRLSVRPA